MDRVLWRHCEAEQGVPDEARSLTPYGVEQAARMAQWLDPRLPPGARILVSPALRAQQTAAALGRRFQMHEALGTATSVDALLEAVEWPEADAGVLVVGHQPTLGQVVSRLVEGDEADRAVAPGDVVWLSNDGDPEARATVKIGASTRDVMR